MTSPLRVATYNVHRCRGRGGATDVGRIAAVLREVAASVVGLQEIDCHASDGGVDQLARLGAELGMHTIAGPMVRRLSVTTGNGLLSAHRILRRRWIDLSVPHREPRGALDVELDVRGTSVRVITTHFGLRGGERASQLTRLLATLESDPRQPTLLLGDFNEWLWRSKAMRELQRYFGVTPALRTFPASRPFLALDRIFVHPRSSLRTMSVHESPLARLASDHLPVHADLELARLSEKAGRIDAT